MAIFNNFSLIEKKRLQLIFLLLHNKREKKSVKISVVEDSEIYVQWKSHNNTSISEQSVNKQTILYESNIGPGEVV